MPALLALAAAAVFGAADFTGGYATRRLPVLSVTLVTNAVGVVVAGLLVVLVDGTMSTAAVTWAAAAGLGGLAGVVFLYLGLARGPNRLVSPLAAVVAALIPVIVGLASGDRPDVLAVVGLALVGPAIWLVAGGDRIHLGTNRTAFGLAAAAGLGFGLFFTLLAQTPDDAGAIPLLVSRVASTLVLLGVVVGRREAASLDVRSLPLPVLAGTLDMSANALYLWSTIDGELAIVGALTNLFPVTTVLLAITILGERLTRAQTTGLILAVAAAALLS